jgi:hypothetical protein
MVGWFMRRFLKGFSIFSLGISLGLSAGIVFDSPSKTLKIDQTNGYIKLDGQISGFSGRLEQAEYRASAIQGDAAIGFSDGIIEVDGAMAHATGTMISPSSDTIRLLGNQSLVCMPGFEVNDLFVQGSGNLLEGAPRLTGSMTLSNETSNLLCRLDTVLTSNPTLNNGTLTLGNDLVFGPDVVVTGSGTLDCQYFSCAVEPREVTWTGTVEFVTPGNLELHSDTVLSGLWKFGGENQTSRINGNGYRLDLTQGGTLWLRAGHGLELVDVVVSGIGNDNGIIVFEDTNSTLTLVGATLSLDGHYSVSQGGLYCRDKDSTIITREYLFTVDSSASYTVDGVRLVIDSLERSVTKNIVPSTNNGLNANFINNGELMAPLRIALDNPLFVDYASYSMTTSDGLATNRPMYATGAHSDIMVFDGNGHILKMPATDDQVLTIANGKTLLFKNITIQGLRSTHLKLLGTGRICFGDGARVALEEDFSLGSDDLYFEGTSVFNGGGQSVDFSAGSGSLIIDHTASTTFCDMRLKGLKNALPSIDFEQYQLQPTKSDIDLSWRPQGDVVVATASGQTPWIVTYDDAAHTFTGAYATGINTHHQRAAWNDLGTYLITGTTPHVYEYDSSAKSFSYTGSVDISTSISQVAQWSPDGNYVAYVVTNPNELRIAQFDSVNKTLIDLSWSHISRTDNAPINDFCWHKDGAHIITAGGTIGSATTQLQVFSVNYGTEAMQLASTQYSFTDAGYSVAATSNSDLLAIAEYGQDPTTSSLMVYTLNTTTSQLALQASATDLVEPYHLDWNKGGDRLVVSSTYTSKSLIPYRYASATLSEATTTTHGRGTGVAYNPHDDTIIAVITTLSGETPTKSALQLSDTDGNAVMDDGSLALRKNAALTFDTCRLEMDYTFSVTSGALTVLHDVELITPNNTLVYQSESPLTIAANSELRIGLSSTLYFNSLVTTGLVQPDTSSILTLDGGTLRIGSSGLTLANGSFLLDQGVTLKSDAASFDKALSIAQSCEVHILPHAVLNVDGLMSLD